jgi:hypothetical protein
VAGGRWRLFEPDRGGLGHFLRLGLLSALVWAPVMVLSVAGCQALEGDMVSR